MRDATGDDHEIHTTSNRSTFSSVLRRTVIGAIVPGSGLWSAGHRLLGGAVLAIFVASCGFLAVVAITRPLVLTNAALDPKTLGVLSVVLPVVGLIWAGLIVVTYRALKPSGLRFGQRILGYAIVAALVVSVVVPFGVGGRYAAVQKDLIEHVFAGNDSQSATRPTAPRIAGDANPWPGRSRINVLLLGSDAGPDRIGTRPDTIILASTNVKTGRTVLFSLPRNLQRIPFPANSPLADAYPGGVYAPDPEDAEDADELEWMLNSIYENVPDQNPGLLKSDNPGADATKLAVSGALGLPVDYYAMVNLQGFRDLIDALGGVTVNVNERIPMGGEESAGLKPGGWIEVGPKQHLDGFDALWFARARYGTDDYHRMKRRRCVIKAIVDQADPFTVLTRYQALAKSSKNMFFTDIPQSVLPSFAQLAVKVKEAPVTSVAFTNEVIDSANPDYRKIRAMVRQAIAESDAGTSRPSSADSLDDACAYHPATSDAPRPAADPTTAPAPKPRGRNQPGIPR